MTLAIEQELRDRLINLSALQRKMDEVVIPAPDDLRGWTYKDLPPLPPVVFAEFCCLVGREHIRWLTIQNGRWRRGQCFISPKGMEKLNAFLAAS